MKYFLIIVLLASAALAQSGRVGPANTTETPSNESSEPRSIRELFEEANAYNRTKFAEFERNNVRYSEELRIKTEKEQKQLAAKYAATAEQRPELSVEDRYYTGLLHWIAENLEGTERHLAVFADSDFDNIERKQTARSLVIIARAKQKKMAEAERALSEYRRGPAGRITELARLYGELAKAYLADKKFDEAAPHAEQAYRNAKLMIADESLRTAALDQILDTGMLVFESQSELANTKAADDVLIDMKDTAASVGSTTFFYYASNKLITYRIESGRKALGLETYSSALLQAGRELPSRGGQNEAIARLKQREKHYRLLGEPAPELLSIDKWFPGTARPLSQFRGRVVLLDFWATWCLPCFEAFPHLTEWQEDLGDQGFSILGVTRYYGRVDGASADNANELEFLKRFRVKYNLPYDFVVTTDQQSQLVYGATALPTAVLIDRKGVVRYIEPGTSSSRMAEIRAMIVKLLAEE
ncbi:MAG: redoxin family protein [Blastocatellia bacterium]|nr:redoxin family protein [Blastocatellia bacterium]